jgi:hypothetical protein
VIPAMAEAASMWRLKLLFLSSVNELGLDPKKSCSALAHTVVWSEECGKKGIGRSRSEETEGS